MNKTKMARLLAVTRMGLTNDRTKDGYGYKYAPLDRVIEILQKPLADNGIAYYFTFDGDFVTIKVVATDQECTPLVESKFPVIEAKNCQDLGKVITYAKRYLLKTVFNISEVDDPDDVDNANFNGAPKGGKKTTAMPNAQFFA